MRRLFAAALTALLLTLTACAGLPTSGAVYPGLSPLDVSDDPDIRFVPDGPQRDASPEEIVNGFLRAGSGPQEGWAIAREFLTPEFAVEWDPRASVTVDRLSDRTAPTEPVDGVSSVEVVPTGLVDAQGAYVPQAGGPVTLSFSLVQVDDQWRISQAPDGVVLFEEEFTSVFQRVALQYFDPSWQYLVPDVRWFPKANIATYVATALIEGEPSPWLAGAVRTAFPEEVVFDAAAVPSPDGVAQVQLNSAALSLGQSTLDQMQAQLEGSLGSANVNGVRMTVNGTALEARASAVRSTRVDSQSLVELTDGRFGFLDGGDVEEVPELTEAVQSVDAVAIEAGPDLDMAAVRTTAGAALRVAGEGAVAVVDERAGLVDPTIDPFGTVWTVPATLPGEVRAAPVDGNQIAVAGAWPAAAGISAMRISRDGTRMAATVSVRGHTEVWVAGVRRSADGAGLTLGEPLVLASLTGDGVDLAWLDNATLGVLVSAGGETALREQPVGGPGTEYTVPAGVTSLVGGNSSARLHAAAGGLLYVRQGPNWAQIATDVRVLAAQQGAP